MVMWKHRYGPAGMAIAFMARCMYRAFFVSGRCAQVGAWFASKRVSGQSAPDWAIGCGGYLRIGSVHEHAYWLADNCGVFTIVGVPCSTWRGLS